MTILGNAAKAAAVLLAAAATLNGSAVASALGAIATQNNIAPATSLPADVQADQVEPRESGDETNFENSKRAARKLGLASLVDAHAGETTADAEEKCLAGAIYFEAKGESFEGQLAVAQVILNRVESGRFARSICGVVFQPGQFSFVRGGAIPAVNQSSKGWRDAVAISRIAQDKLHPSRADDALFFHATRVSPRWRLTRVTAIGNHIFYR